MKRKVFVSKSNPNLKFFVESFDGSFIVFSQFGSYPKTEAHDDWFANRNDAEQIAEAMASEA